MATTLSKTCVRCKQSLPMEAFFSAKNRPDGKYPYCRECNKAWRKERAFKDPEAEHQRRLRKKEYDAKRHKADPVAARERAIKLYEGNREDRKAYIREWQAANIEVVRAYKAANKHQRRAVEADGITGPELLAWKKAQPKVCYWCGVKCARRYHVDHYVALSKGGAHDASNLVIACPTCNLRKHAKDPLDFAKEVGRLL